jgi:hypothetical protein
MAKDAPSMPDDATEIIDSIEITSSGSELTISATFETSKLVKAGEGFAGP